MRALILGLAIVFSLSGLSACSSVGDIFDSEETAAEAAAAQPQFAKVPVVRIDNLELGRLYRGYMLVTYGVAPGAGYFAPELRIRYDGQLGQDGYYEFDFVAVPPRDRPARDNTPIIARILRADYELTPEMLRVARGVRVWSARDSVEGRF